MSYTRTQAGTAAVLNPKVAMPRPLKALLIAMNGQFDPYLYASRLPDATDVSAMLQTLVKAGYARAMPDTGNQTVGFAASQSAQAATRSGAHADRALQDAVAQMTDFVMGHLPGEAIELVLALESLTSTAQLEAALGAYEATIRHLGALAARHLAEVKHLLHPV